MSEAVPGDSRKGGGLPTTAPPPPLPAGPPLALEGPQLQQLVTGHFAIGLGDVDPYEMVDAVFLPLEVIHANGSGALPVEGTALNIRGAEVSALQRIDGLLHLRLWNATDRAAVASVIGRRGMQQAKESLPDSLISLVLVVATRRKDCLATAS